MASIKKVTKKTAAVKKTDKTPKAEKTKQSALDLTRTRFTDTKADSVGACSRFAYIILALTAGFWGVHNFYAGRKKCAWGQLVLSVSVIVIVLLTLLNFYVKAAGSFRNTEEFLWISRLVISFLWENSPQNADIVKQISWGLGISGLASIALIIWITLDMFLVKKYGGGSAMISNSNDRKSRMAYIALAIFPGVFGVHNFYALRIYPALAQLALTLLGYMFFMPIILPVYIWALCDIVLIKKDAKGNKLI